MRPEDRQRDILDLLHEEGEVRVEALAAHFGVSVETIRRDLAHLDAVGAARKIHGGARRPGLSGEASLGERIAAAAPEKARIADHLAGVVAPGETLFLDTGSTTLACARRLAEIDGLTVITNSTDIARVLTAGSAGVRVFLLGGTFSAGNAQTVGAMVLEQIGLFHADTAVLTVTALDAEAGATDSDAEEAAVARAMIAHARRTVLVADRSKFGRVAAHAVCRLDQADMLVSEGGVIRGTDMAKHLHSAVPTGGSDTRTAAA